MSNRDPIEVRGHNDLVAEHFRRSCETLSRAADDPLLRAAIHEIADAITAAFRGGHKLLIAGNGGSAADAQHIAGDFLSRLNFDRNPLPAINNLCPLRNAAVITSAISWIVARRPRSSAARDSVSHERRKCSATRSFWPRVSLGLRLLTVTPKKLCT